MARGKAMTRAQRSLSGERVFNALLSVDREPFRALLEEMIGGRPTVAAIQKWAAENPDRWANSVGIFARLVGYDFKGTVAHEHTHRHLHLHMLSDAELEVELARMRSGDTDVVRATLDAESGAADGASDDVTDDCGVGVPFENGASGAGEDLW